MSKYKFGDKVWHEEYGEGVIFSKNKGENTWAAFEGGIELEYSDIELNNPYFRKLKPVSALIPCSERMPEHDGFYLVLMQDISTGSHFYSVIYFADGEWVDSFESVVTHWQPLPTPPEGE